MINNFPGNNSTKEERSLIDQMLATVAPDGPNVPISSPHEHDVLCGRGGLTNHHKGNVTFRKLVEMNKRLYATSPKTHKMVVSLSIVESIRGQKPPGRFLQRDAKTGLWHDIGKRKALHKTSQALREGGVFVDRESKKRNSRKRARESERCVPCVERSPASASFIGENTPTHLVNIEQSLGFMTSGKKCKTVASGQNLEKERPPSLVSDDDEASLDSNSVGSHQTQNTVPTACVAPVAPCDIYASAVPSPLHTQREQDERNNVTHESELPSCFVDALMEIVEEEEDEEGKERKKKGRRKQKRLF